jgi:hypothetical protein
MTDTITIKKIEFNREAFAKMSNKVKDWIDKDSDQTDFTSNVTPRMDEASLNLIKLYVDHHSQNLGDEKPVAMKPIKSNVHSSITALFNEFDPWDGTFIDELDHNQRVKLKNAATELSMMALIDKICIYLAFHMTQALNGVNADTLNEQKMMKLFKSDLNIDLPNPTKKVEEEEKKEE